MHGRKKSTQPLTQIEIDGINKKITTYQSIVSIIENRRKLFDKSIETLDIITKLLQNNPDYYSIWNYRREILISLYNDDIGLTNDMKSNDLIPLDKGINIQTQELLLSTNCIKRNSKSYCAWYHRKWILNHFVVNYDEELKLCNELLKLDQRNFHCWTYRKFVYNLSNLSIDNELKFTENKILENFSNYSAFHYRSVYLSYNQLTNDVIDYELQIIENAVFTEPDDQSVWWYLQFLLKQCYSLANQSNNYEWYKNILYKQYSMIQQLLSIESNSKWALVALVEISNMLTSLHSNDETITIQDVDVKVNKIEILHKLISIDPIHKNRYQYLLK